MKLRELLSRTEYTRIDGNTDLEITGISRDDRNPVPGGLFVCTKGARFDTHDAAVIRELCDKGVSAFIAEREIELPKDSKQTVVLVPDTRTAGALVYCSWYGNPGEKLTIIGITGSKGKTTTAHMLYHVLKAAGKHPGIISTNGVEYERTDCFGAGAGRSETVSYELANTTPDYDQLQKILRDMADAGLDSCVLEVSSQAMKLHRCDGLVFDIGILVNIQEGDHVGPDEHESFEDYIACKAELMNHSKQALINRDDPYIDDVLKYVRPNVPVAFFSAESIPVESFNADGMFIGMTEAPLDHAGPETADYSALGIAKSFDEERGRPFLSFRTEGKVVDTFRIDLPGAFNVRNALAAIAAAHRLGIAANAIKKGLSEVHIKGRSDIVYRGKFSVCVDFAHNGASARHHLEALREYRPQRLICVFGADGNRSKGRRYGMGEAAGTLADFSIVTSGHNRWESFEEILADTRVGLEKAGDPKYIAIRDREEAIRYAIDHAEEGDLITIIGLGHESWQEDHGVKRHYNDEEFVMSLLQEKGLL